ncbi:MAG TPA: cation:proton antiporter [Conexibacter sp.]|nr:cation:proton antiporter [Conexibacter sp.]
MRLGEADLARLLIAVGVLLVAARAVGALFARRRQPAVIGEILAGVLLGPLMLGWLVPGVTARLLPASVPVGPAVGACYHLGVIALMFAVGVELRIRLRREERVTAVAIAIAGMAVPFALGVAAFAFVGPGPIAGPAHSEVALALVFGAGIAVTSIPIMSRILRDLGLSTTPFARTAIAAAIADDVVLYAVLGIAVGLARPGGSGFGLASALQLDASSWQGVLYYVASAPLVLAAGFALAASRRAKPLLDRVRADVAAQLAFVFAIVVGCLLLDVHPLFGGLVAGVAMGNRGEPSAATRDLAHYGLVLLAPLYFAIVGLRVDLTHGFDVSFFLAFLTLAIAIKAAGVYAGARLARKPPAVARAFTVTMSARGGPGIVLASLALDAGIINRMFFASLVGMTILTTLFAGWWLGRAAARAGGLFGTPEAGALGEVSQRQEISAPAGMSPS